jgi:hypothetical protein
MATESQRLFNNTYSPLRYRRDIWRGLTKAEKRLEARVLAATFFWSGGDITRAQKSTPKGPGRHINFTKDVRSAAYNRDVTRYFRGDNPGAETRFTYRAAVNDDITPDTVKIIHDASERATIRDQMNLLAVDREHNAAFKLAA